jgi:hypothetical protein
LDYLQGASQCGRRFSELNMFLVPRIPQLDRVLQEAVRLLDLFVKMTLKGTTTQEDPNYQQLCLRSMTMMMMIGTTTNLSKLQLSHMSLNQEDAAALKHLLQENNDSTTTTTTTTTTSTNSRRRKSSSIEQLLLGDVSFLEEGSLEELTQGFQTNTSLRVIAMTSCDLLDEAMAQIFDSLASASSPSSSSSSSSLHTLLFYGNQC